MPKAGGKKKKKKKKKPMPVIGENGTLNSIIRNTISIADESIVKKKKESKQKKRTEVEDSLMQDSNSINMVETDVMLTTSVMMNEAHTAIGDSLMSKFKLRKNQSVEEPVENLSTAMDRITKHAQSKQSAFDRLGTKKEKESIESSSAQGSDAEGSDEYESEYDDENSDTDFEDDEEEADQD